MSRKRKPRHKRRTADRYLASLATNMGHKNVRLVRRHAKKRKLVSRWRAENAERFAFTSLVGVKPRASTKLRPVVYHVTALREGRWKTQHFATRSVKSTRIKGLHIPRETTRIYSVNGTEFAVFSGMSEQSAKERFGENYTMSRINGTKQGAKVSRPTMVVGINVSKRDISDYRSLVSQEQE